MADLNELREELSRNSRHRRERLAEARDLYETGEATADYWPQLRESIEKRVIPHLKKGIKRIETYIEPRQLKQLGRERLRLKRLRRITWRHPLGWMIRLRVTFFAAVILIYYLLWILLAGFLIAGIIYVFVRFPELFDRIVSWFS